MDTEITTDLPHAYQEWHCGRCDLGLTQDGDNTLRCETCGAAYQPDGSPLPDEED